MEVVIIYVTSAKRVQHEVECLTGKWPAELQVPEGLLPMM